MNNLANNINNAIKTAFEEFCSTISEKYEIDKTELENIWNKTCSDMKITINKKEIDSKLESKPAPKTIDIKALLAKKTTKNEPTLDISSLENSKTVTPSISCNASDAGGCQHVMLRGARSGQTCGSKPMKNSLFCVKHKKSDEESKKPEFKPKKSSTEELPACAIVARKNIKLNKFWHPDTGFVFKSANEPTVIGKNINDKIFRINEEDIDECKKLNLKYEITKSYPKQESMNDSEPELDLDCEVETNLETELETNNDEKSMSAIRKITAVPEKIKSVIKPSISAKSVTKRNDSVDSDKEEKNEKKSIISKLMPKVIEKNETKGETKTVSKRNDSSESDEEKVEKKELKQTIISKLMPKVTEKSETKGETKTDIKKLSTTAKYTAAKYTAAKTSVPKSTTNKLPTEKTTPKLSPAKKDIKSFIEKIRKDTSDESGPEDIEDTEKETEDNEYIHEEEELLEEDD